MLFTKKHLKNEISSIFNEDCKQAIRFGLRINEYEITLDKDAFESCLYNLLGESMKNYNLKFLSISVGYVKLERINLCLNYRQTKIMTERIALSYQIDIFL